MFTMQLNGATFTLHNFANLESLMRENARTSHAHLTYNEREAGKQYAYEKVADVLASLRIDGMTIDAYVESHIGGDNDATKLREQLTAANSRIRELETILEDPDRR